LQFSRTYLREKSFLPDSRWSLMSNMPYGLISK
jgi:hypothetical protein